MLCSKYGLEWKYMIKCIVAIEGSGGIGYCGHMPWPKLSRDMKWFRELTTGGVVVMGSKTWASIGKLLPGRINVVISSRIVAGANLTYDDPIVALADLGERFVGRDIYVIGGSQLYDSVMSLVQEFYVTHISRDYVCDRFFDIDKVRGMCYSEEVLHYASSGECPEYSMVKYVVE